MQQVKEPHARLWREKPADRAGLHSSSYHISDTHTQAGTRQGSWSDKPISSKLILPPETCGSCSGRQEAGLGAGHSLHAMENPVLR